MCAVQVGCKKEDPAPVEPPGPTAEGVPVAPPPPRLEAASVKEAVTQEFIEVVEELLNMASSSLLVDFLEDEARHEPLLQSFMALSNRVERYDQIRFLDMEGMEVIRVDRVDGAAVQVAAEQLQNKGSRYYFKDAVKLERGDVFVSPFDLNKERGAVSVPHKPMIRFATPVFNSAGEKGGLLLFNYFGARIQRRLAEVSVQKDGDAYLLNSQGYWLSGPEEGDLFGFMFEDKQELTLQARSPVIWEKITTENAGQFDTGGATYHFDTVYPQAMQSGSKEGYWKLVTRVEKSQSP